MAIQLNISKLDGGQRAILLKNGQHYVTRRGESLEIPSHLKLKFRRQGDDLLVDSGGEVIFIKDFYAHELSGTEIFGDKPTLTWYDDGGVAHVVNSDGLSGFANAAGTTTEAEAAPMTQMASKGASDSVAAAPAAAGSDSDGVGMLPWLLGIGLAGAVAAAGGGGSDDEGAGDGAGGGDQGMAAAVQKISNAAESNTATASMPELDDYTAAGVNGVSAANLAAINSALDTIPVNGAAVNTTAKIQALVDAYNVVLNGADGLADGDVGATQAQLGQLGVTGLTAPSTSLLNSVIDRAAKTAVDTVAELQALADAAKAVIGGAAGGTAPTLAELQALGLSGVTGSNLSQVQAAIAGTPDDGSGVDTVAELQGIVSAVTGSSPALQKIANAAEFNTATMNTPDLVDYVAAGVNGVTAERLGAINSALDTTTVNGAAVDTTPEIQSLVNAYNVVLNAADGLADGDTGATQAQLGQLGVTGLTAPSTSLLNSIVDRSPLAAVDTVPELQTLADAAQAVMTGAAGGTAPTLAQLQALGLVGVTENNLSQLQVAIAGTPDNGSSVDTIAELQGLLGLALAGQEKIGLGGQGQLIAPVQVEGGWYYFWDRDSNGIASPIGDMFSHNELDGIFKYDINGNQNPGIDTNSTYRYATVNGVKLELVSLGSDTANLLPAANGAFDARGTAVSSGAVNNPTYDDLLAIWDAYNGSGTGTGTAASGKPSEWVSPLFYWTATQEGADKHYMFDFDGHTVPNEDAISGLAVVKVIG